MDIYIQDTRGRACISTEGAQLLSWQNQEGQELIWQRDPAFWPRCAPLLFPVIGNCQNDELYMQNRLYPMPKHGFLRDQEFAVVRHDVAEVVLEYRHEGPALSHYPWPFIFRATHRLEEGRLLLHYAVENLSKEEMYYCFGGHPGFNLPMEDAATFEDYVVHFPQDKTLETVAYNFAAKAFDPKLTQTITLEAGNLPLTRELFAGDAVFMPRLQSTSVDLLHHRTRRGLRCSFTGFRSLALWSPYPVDAPFICLEPWQGAAIWTDEDNHLENKRDVQRLAPQEIHYYKISLTYIGGYNEK